MTTKKTTKPKNYRYIRTVNKKTGYISYFDKLEQKPVKKTIFFKQFADASRSELPFKYDDLKSDEKKSLNAIQRIKVGNRFIPKEKSDKVIFQAKAKGIKLGGKGENIGIENLRDILAQTRQTWLNTDQTLKKMIAMNKAGKLVRIKYKGEEKTGAEAIEVLQKYIAYLRDKADKEEKQVAFILMKNKQK